MKKILIYLGKEAINGIKIKNVLEENAIDYSFLSDDHLSKTMNQLIEIDEKEIKQGIRNGMIYVLNNDIEFIQFLDKILKEEEIDIERKAVRTDVNVEWTLEALMNEIDEEFEYYKLKDALYKKVMNPDKEKLKTDKDYLRVMSMAYSLLEDEKVEKEILNIALKTIERKENEKK